VGEEADTRGGSDRRVIIFQICGTRNEVWELL
jgi:hypothetical protein